MSTPQSIVNICSGVALNSRYEHSIYFASAAAQQEYFAGKVVKTLPAYSYIRKSWSLKVAATMEQAKSWSYLFFRNGTSSKVYYYFINNIEYINDATVELTLEIDVLQTYMFDYSLLPSFIERQHVTDDTIGRHTMDEGLDLGDFIVNNMGEFTGLNAMCILILTSINLGGTTAETVTNAYGMSYGNVYSGLKLWAVDAMNWSEWSTYLDTLSELGKLDGVVNMWVYPKRLVKLGGENTWTDDILCKVVQDIDPYTFTIPSYLNVAGYNFTLDGYKPKNNKLYTHPFNFLYVTNNNGGSAVYKWECFEDYKAEFLITGALAPDAGVKLAPRAYNGVASSTTLNTDASFHEGLTLAAYPTCAWDADIYKIWLAQNQHQNQLAMATGGIKIAAGAVGAAAGFVTGGLTGLAGVGTLASGLQQVAGVMAAKADKEVEPPQARGTYSASVAVANNKQTFSYYLKSIKAEYARAIDEYFTMYGYKLNRVQTPNVHARQAFTFVKTIGCHIRANLCNEDTVKIESIFDNGITFWVNGDKICDYSQSNSPI